jgi:pyridoxal phosphate enzyme (YggS family)
LSSYILFKQIKKDKYFSISKEVGAHNAILVAVSKTKPVEAIKELYDLGHRDFAENYVQELLQKQPQLPNDINWHFIGHLQTNKVKSIAPFIHLIHSIDSLKLLTEINKQGSKFSRVIDVLLQVHIAREETKFGFDQSELIKFIEQLKTEALKNISIRGLMGMASLTGNTNEIRTEFSGLHSVFQKLKLSYAMPSFTFLSMGMSSDYKIALEEGSTMIRVGSLLFGDRG